MVSKEADKINSPQSDLAKIAEALREARAEALGQIEARWHPAARASIVVCRGRGDIRTPWDRFASWVEARHGPIEGGNGWAKKIETRRQTIEAIAEQALDPGWPVDEDGRCLPFLPVPNDPGEARKYLDLTEEFLRGLPAVMAEDLAVREAPPEVLGKHPADCGLFVLPREAVVFREWYKEESLVPADWEARKMILGLMPELTVRGCLVAELDDLLEIVRQQVAIFGDSPVVDDQQQEAAIEGEWIKHKEATKILMDAAPAAGKDLKCNNAKSKISNAAKAGKIESNGKRGTDLLLKKTSVVAWVHNWEHKEIARADRNEADL